MNTLDREIEALRPVLGTATDALVRRERREVFSIHPELRIVAWLGAVLVATAAGIVLKKNLDRIGPVALALAIGLAAAGCYAWAWWRRSRASLADDYVLLLGALLVSADVAFVETQFHLLGGAWPRHFLVLAVVHGVTAYLFDSRLVLSLSISALAAWIGVERRSLDPFGGETIELALRGYTCAAALLMWRALDARYRRSDSFHRTLEHFAANIALWASLVLTFEHGTRLIGCILTLAIAAAVVLWGMRRGGEPFVLYAFLYAVLALDVLLIDAFGDWLAAFLIFTSLVASIVGLIVIHLGFRRRRA